MNLVAQAAAQNASQGGEPTKPTRPPSAQIRATGLLRGRFGGLALFVLSLVGFSQLARLLLLFQARADVTWDGSLVLAFAFGLLFDLGMALLAGLPLWLALTLLPERAFRWRPVRFGVHLLVLLTSFVMLFSTAAEWNFWEEFGARFNFIAVDYLVYTTEVLANIRESYPIPLLLSLLAALALLAYAVIRQTGYLTRWMESAEAPWGRRWRPALFWLAGSAGALLLLDLSRLPKFTNNFHRELAQNGVWSLFAAFRDNSLEYERFYRSLPPERAFELLHAELASEDPLWIQDPAVQSHVLGKHAELLSWPGTARSVYAGPPAVPQPAFGNLRYVRNPGPEQHLNIVQITVESLSAEFLGAFGNTEGLTPNLDGLVDKALFFENFYATGNRTDRGMEALTLSLPPTPGRSLIKREGNEHLFTLGSVLRSRGYETAFLYSGYGYFDNMNHFFGENGYRVIDRAAVSEADVTFANAWGACDEDLYRWTIRALDQAHAAGRPFHGFVMTTSNHRPYTYPEGCIDLPPKVSGRRGAVKYTDYAIGRLLAEAATRPWFNQTVFVIVADHCAGSAGKAELPVQRYHIPLFIYAPGGQIVAGRVATLCSQIDVAPTLLSLLGFSYGSRFFGQNILGDAPNERALMGTYQKLGLLVGERLTVLRPVRAASSYHYDRPTKLLTEAPLETQLLERTIAYYASANWLWLNAGLAELTPEQQQELSRAASEVSND